MWGDAGLVDSVLVLRTEIGVLVCLQEVMRGTYKSVLWTETSPIHFSLGFRPSQEDPVGIFGRPIPKNFDAPGLRSPRTGKSHIRRLSALI